MPPKFGGGGVKCGKCQKTVYPAEEIKINFHTYHKACFRCKECNKILTGADYAALDDSVEYYCKPHFKQAFLKSGGYKDLQWEANPDYDGPAASAPSKAAAAPVPAAAAAPASAPKAVRRASKAETKQELEALLLGAASAATQPAIREEAETAVDGADLLAQLTAGVDSDGEDTGAAHSKAMAKLNSATRAERLHAMTEILTDACKPAVDLRALDTASMDAMKQLQSLSKGADAEAVLDLLGADAAEEAEQERLQAAADQVAALLTADDYEPSPGKPAAAASKAPAPAPAAARPAAGPALSLGGEEDDAVAAALAAALAASEHVVVQPDDDTAAEPADRGGPAESGAAEPVAEAAGKEEAAAAVVEDEPLVWTVLPTKK